jgi:plastocyanin
VFRAVWVLQHDVRSKEARMRVEFVAGCGLLASVLAWPGCGGSDGYGGSPTAPSGPPVPQASVTINIAGERGAQSFVPNPASVNQGQTVAWRNNDGVTHRIVLNDGSLDSGDILPGATSRPLTLAADGANYHCSLHPTMVGAINASSGAPPPCTGPYC